MPAAAVTYQRTREMTIDELLLENRVVFMIGEINQASAARVMMQMLYLENQKRGQEINLYINSPGGAVDDTLAIYDTMRFITSPVATYCLGRAYSGGSILLAAFLVLKVEHLHHDAGGGSVVDLADEEDDAVFEQELVDRHFAGSLVCDAG